jgi:site-specific DNA recombinase
MRKPDRVSHGASVRCAIYTRKSSDEGLEQEFNSLDAQREACEAYILSQKQTGWICLPEMYDDGGLSGGTMDRPALRRLLGEIAAGKVRTVVVYKVDRLTRSLADFAKIVDVLDAHDASFVSVTQQFNTTTSMGRLTLNMLLSFAQFEREIAGERIRDKIAASKAKGMWMGGNVPLGYDVQDRKLVVNAAEAETVGIIFRRYAELGSVRLLGEDLDRRSIVSKRREGAHGVLSGGNRFSHGALYTLLQNRIYLGQISHQENVYPGLHAPILDADLWQIVQDRLATNRNERLLGASAEAPSLLASLVVDAQGDRMTPTHAVKRGKRYRYYVSRSLITGIRSATSNGQRVPAGDVEGLVLDRIRSFLASEVDVSDALASIDLDAPTQRAVLARATHLSEQWATMPSIEQRRIVRCVIERVRIEGDKILLQLKLGAILSNLTDNAPPAQCRTDAQDALIALSIPAKLRRAGKEIRLAIGKGTRDGRDPRLVGLLHDAFATREALLSGRDDSIDAMASRLGVSRSQLSSLFRLSYLSPQIIRAIQNGHQRADLTAAHLMSIAKDLPHDWQQQWRDLGFAIA